MRSVKITEIQIGEDRQRKEFDADALHDLSESIDNLGLLQPLVLTRPENMLLIAGERRLRACRILMSRGKAIRFQGQTLPLGEVPVIFHFTKDEIEREEAELHENLIRVDLTWQERASAIDRLHKLRKSQNPEHTAQDTVKEVLQTDEAPGGSATRLVRDASIVAKHLDDPDVAKAKTQAEALKIIRKKAERQHSALLASLPSGQTEHEIIRGDACEVMQTLPANHFSCIITDPPYGINADRFGDQAVVEHEYEDSEDTFIRCVSALATEGFRVARAQAHLYMFLDLRLWAVAKEILERGGWSVWHSPIIWVKYNGMLPLPDYAPRRCYEAVMFANKGGKKVAKVESDVILDAKPPANRLHAAQKPASAYINLLSRSCFPGDTVLDPFAGSGTVFPAANALSLLATGINLSETDYNMAKLRMSEKAVVDLLGG